MKRLSARASTHWTVVVMSHPSIRNPETSPVAASVNMSTFFFHRFSLSCVIIPSSDWNAQELSSAVSLKTSMRCVGVHCGLLCFRKLSTKGFPRRALVLFFTSRFHAAPFSSNAQVTALPQWDGGKRECKGKMKEKQERGRVVEFPRERTGTLLWSVKHPWII